MKSDGTTIKYHYVRKSTGLGAHVPKDIPPKSAPHKKQRLPMGMTSRAVSIPPEYELVLQEMYPNVSIGIAIRKFIMEHIQFERK
jgi:hypothetical protein